MKETPFKFGLERVRQVRAHDEDRAKEDLAQSLGRRTEREQQLAATDARLAAARDTMLGTSGAALVSRQAYLERLERSRDDAAIRLQACDAEVAQRRASLATAAQGREVLDRLADRQRDAHRLQQARLQGAFLDEIALQGHVRRAAA